MPPAAQLIPRLRFPDRGAEAFGPGKAELLQFIAATGSLRSAAAEMGMSYQRAWMLMRQMNRLFDQPLVVVSRGGGSGGGATLTALGQEVLRRYLSMEAACQRATRADWSALQRRLRR